MRGLLFSLLFLLVFVSAAMFFAQNNDSVTLHYFVGKLELQLNWVMIACFLIGFFSGLLFLFLSYTSTRIQLKHLQRKIKRSEAELKNLRALPIRDDF